MLEYVTIKKLSLESGYTIDAINSKIKRGDWEEGVVWILAPDGRRMIILEGYYQWIEKQGNVSECVRRAQRQ